MPWTRSLVPPRHSVLNQWDLLEPLGIDPPDRARDPGDDAARSGRRRAASTNGCAAAGVDRSARRSSCCTSAPAIRFAAGRRRRLPQSAAALASADRGAPHHHHVRPIGSATPRKRVADAGASARRRRRQRGSSGRASSTCRSCARWSSARRSTSAATAARCTSRRRRARRSSRCSARRCRSGRCRGAIRRSAPSAVDAGPLPCRPCHQRHCVPGDFRCLTAISPTMVIDSRARQLLSSESREAESTDDLSLTAGVPPRDRLEQIGLLVARRHRRRHAVVDRRRADPAGGRGRWRGWSRTSRAASGSRRRRSSGRSSPTPR